VIIAKKNFVKKMNSQNENENDAAFKFQRQKKRMIQSSQYLPWKIRQMFFLSFENYYT
jgi:hypothetical protein